MTAPASGVIPALTARYFGLRHGQSEANALELVVSDPRRGVPGVGLTAAGREQVRAAVRGCPGLGPATLVVSSDFRRARESAELACELLGAAPPELDLRLRERWFGAHEGRHHAAYHAVWERDARDPTHRAHGVESAAAVTQRMCAVVRDLEARGLRGRAVLLVAHGDPLQLLAAALRGWGPHRHRELTPWAPGEVRRLDLSPLGPAA